MFIDICVPFYNKLAYHFLIFMIKRTRSETHNEYILGALMINHNLTSWKVTDV